MDKELYQYLACDYFATGEGRTICLLITRAYPFSEDYVIETGYDETGYYPDLLKNSAKLRAAKEFIKYFGSYLAQGAENLPREEFLKKYGHFVPEVVQKMLTDNEQPGNMVFKQEFHFNFS